MELIIDKISFRPGEAGIVRLNVGRLPSHTRIDILAHVFRGDKLGPSSLILAGVHGDEINGIEIARRVLSSDILNNIVAGTVIVIPLLNIYGFINFNRYVPDGKDVNRSFPGTSRGSLASRIARTLTKNILPHVDYIFDFHTGGDSRYNYPQVRYSGSDEEAFRLAKIFNPAYIIKSGIISKSLRKAAKDMDIPILVYEGGESIRLDANAIDTGHQGLLNCLGHLGHIDHQSNSHEDIIHVTKTTWIRASYSGIFIWSKRSGEEVNKGDILGTINDPNGQKFTEVTAHRSGIIIGQNNASVVNQGDALFNLGYEYEVI